MLVPSAGFLNIILSVDKKNQHTVQDALEVLLGDDGWSDEDLYKRNHTPNNKDKRRDESSVCGDSDIVNPVI